MKGPQSGVSEAGANWVGKKTDCEPGDVLAVFCDEVTARENSKDRFLPMFRTTPRLSRHLTGKQDDESSLRINLAHVAVYFGWASSSSRLANKPIRYGLADEIDKPGWDAGKNAEASPLNLLRKRLITFKKMGISKLFKISTATVESGNIYQEFISADVCFDYHSRCPQCGRHQVMIFENIRWEGGSGAIPADIENGRLARYHCAHCEALWDDDMRDEAQQGGEWRHRPPQDSSETPLELFTYLETFRPPKIAFHLPSWMTYFVSMSEAAASFLRGLTSLDEMKDFQNAHAAMPYIPQRREQKVDLIKNLKDDRPSGVVPGGAEVACLLFGADTQDDGFWYEIRAFGYGIPGTSWQVKEGFVDSLDGLDEILWSYEYRDVDDHIYHVPFGMIDSQGHRTSEVYDWCIKHRGKVLPIKGEQRKSTPMNFTNLEFYPGSKKPLPGGVQLAKLDTNYYKNKLYTKLKIESGDPGSWNYHFETTNHWCQMMVTEYIDEATGLWACPDGADNHGFDCSVYVLAAYDYYGVRNWPKPDPEPEQQPATRRDDNAQTIRQRPSWFKKRR